MTAPKPIIELIDRFDRNKDAYQSGQYNETQLRREFLDPFFESLGWDIYNKQGYAEAYKDVIHEDAIKIGTATKAPDYCFRIGGTRKFFVEAKKPAINLKEDISPAFQLRRYSWSAKLPLSILTDFEEFAVYDCRIKPIKTDHAATARIKYLTYTDYLNNWDELVSIFSREAVLKGSFDKYIESTKIKKGTAEVDDAFLTEIEIWRDNLARNIALRNPNLTQRELNFAVQRTIDRLIFLRICEDRGIEAYGRLMALQNSDRVYPKLCDLFHRADERYNSGLFHFSKEKDRAESPDQLTLNIAIDDKPLKEIIKNLYYPDSAYEFSVLPSDILGQVYEQFLGKVIRLTAGHRAVVEDKPEVKKAGGVYYTPTYIVDYIVKNTVGKLLGISEVRAGSPRPKDDVGARSPRPPEPNLKGRGNRAPTPKDIAQLRILDPACGSGSFLINAYQLLLDWHRDYYVNDDIDKHKKELYQVAGGDYRLTTAERKRILLNNIYGVDIDPQAVEVTKLSLLLKVLEGENEQTISNQLRLFHERALPDLGNNIKCGNSLIGPDFYDNQQLNFLDDDERYRINVFDWEREFPSIFSHETTKSTKKDKISGFDVVIGNPPYGYLIPDVQQDYYTKTYRFQDFQKDFYLLFLERYELLLKNNGLLGVIVSNTWLQSLTLCKIRQYLTTYYKWLLILHLPEKVFKAVVDTHVLVFQKSKIYRIEDSFLNVDIRKGKNIEHWHKLPLNIIPKTGAPINIVTPVINQQIYKKIMENSLPLKDICEVYNGVKPFEKGKGNPPQTDQIMTEKPFVKESKKPGKDWSKLLRGSLINRYLNLWENNSWILYGPWLAAPRDSKIFDEPIKIMVRQTGDSIIATLIEKGFIARDNLHIVLMREHNYDLRYILGLINSKLIDFIYTIMNPEKGEALAQVKKQHVEQLPIRKIDFNDIKDKSQHDRMIELVDRMLSLHKQLASTKTPDEQTALQRQIDATDHQINRLVYELYGLTEEEIKIVEDRK